MILRLSERFRGYMSFNDINGRRGGWVGGWQVMAAGYNILLIQMLKPKWRANGSLMVKFVENARIRDIKLVLYSGDGGARKHP